MKAIFEFLPCATPREWLECALKNQSILLIDHANCEKKAASTAMSLLYRHTTKPELMTKMSQLAREELTHFQKVTEILLERKIVYSRLSPSRYANKLRSLIAHEERWQLVDTLIVGAFIEARSCERFAALAPELDGQLQRFYLGLLKSESRHFCDYLELAQKYSSADITDRVQQFRLIEEKLITGPDPDFRFHSGIPESSDIVESFNSRK